MAKKGKKGNGDILALIIIIGLLIGGFAFFLGRGFVDVMFDKTDKKSPETIEKSNSDEKKEAGKSFFERFLKRENDNNKESEADTEEKSEKKEINTQPERADREVRIPQPREDREEKTVSENKKEKSTVKSEKKTKTRKRKITKQEKKDLDLLENTDRNRNSQQSDLELLENADRKINMEKAGE